MTGAKCVNSANKRKPIEQKGIGCFNCNEPGHKARDCPKPITCYGCQKVGHMARDCQTCRYCKEEGHFKDKCPKLTCDDCGGKHLKRKCPGMGKAKGIAPPWVEVDPETMKVYRELAEEMKAASQGL